MKKASRNGRSIQIIKRWDDTDAKYVYTLQQEHPFRGWEDLIFSGDDEWAEKQKEHYECEIVEGGKDER